MKKIFFAALLAINGSALTYSQDETQIQEKTNAIVADEVVTSTELPSAPTTPPVDDYTVLSDADKTLPDSLRQEREFELMRDLNPKDSLLEDQKIPEKRFITLGFTVGATATTYGLTGEKLSDAGFGPGAQVGINIDLPFGQTKVGQYFSIQPELLFSFHETPMKELCFVPDGGFDHDGDPTGSYEKFDATDDLIYMSVPINVKASARFKKGRAFISAGPMVSLGLFGNRSLDGHNTLLFQSDADAQQEDPIYNNVDFSLYSRLGYDCDRGLTASLGFQLGFIDLVKESNGSSVKTRCISINVGYNF